MIRQKRRLAGTKGRHSLDCLNTTSPESWLSANSGSRRTRDGYSVDVITSRDRSKDYERMKEALPKREKTGNEVSLVGHSDQVPIIRTLFLRGMPVADHVRSCISHTR